MEVGREMKQRAEDETWQQKAEAEAVQKQTATKIDRKVTPLRNVQKRGN